jgi:hypothetical protein
MCARFLAGGTCLYESGSGTLGGQLRLSLLPKLKSKLPWMTNTMAFANLTKRLQVACPIHTMDMLDNYLSGLQLATVLDSCKTLEPANLRQDINLCKLGKSINWNN